MFYATQLLKLSEWVSYIGIFLKNKFWSWYFSKFSSHVTHVHSPFYIANKNIAFFFKVLPICLYLSRAYTVLTDWPRVYNLLPVRQLVLYTKLLMGDLESCLCHSFSAKKVTGKIGIPLKEYHMLGRCFQLFSCLCHLIRINAQH